MGSPFPGLTSVFLASPYYLPSRPPEARAVPDSAAGRRTDAQEVDRGAPHDRPAVLIVRLGQRLDDAPVRFAQRSPGLDDRDPNTERVTRSHRIGQRAGAAERKLSTSSRMVRAAVPAAGDQPAEETVGRDSRIDVIGQRIEPFSKDTILAAAMLTLPHS
jgi:hypothetical protein